MWRDGNTGDAELTVEEICAMPATGHSTVHNERGDDRPWVAVPVVDILPGTALPLAILRHAAPRCGAAAASVPAGAARAYIQRVCPGGALDAGRPSQGRQGMRPPEEGDRFGGVARITAARGDEFGVVLRLGAGEIDFGEHFAGERVGPEREGNGKREQEEKARGHI